MIFLLSILADATLTSSLIIPVKSFCTFTELNAFHCLPCTLMSLFYHSLGNAQGWIFSFPSPPTTHTTSSCLHCSQVMWSAGPWIGCCHGNWGGIFQGSLVTAPD